MKLLLSSAVLCSAALTANFAQNGEQAANAPVVRGPVFSGTIRAPKSNQAVAMKGIVVTVGEDKNAYICYETDLLRAAVGWTGDFLEFGNTQVQIAWPPPPQIKGSPVFGTKPEPGWAKGDSLADPRPNKQGPLPKDWAHYTGLFLNGDDVVISYTVGQTPVLEMPGYHADAGRVFSRSFEIGPSTEPMVLAVCTFDSAPDDSSKPVTQSEPGGKFTLVGKTMRTAVGIAGANERLEFDRDADHLRLKVPAHDKTLRFTLFLGAALTDESVKQFKEMLNSSFESPNLAALCKGGPAQWTEEITTKGTVGANDEAYTVDTITEPVANPYNVKTFFGGFDFFPDGRAAICTFHGEVFVVSGIDDKLEKITWKRYGNGLFQPLGIKIVDNKVYVLGRDQITRLHDLNNDGEADYYENFNNDTVVTSNYHEFSLDLQTDREGNFYFVKGSPWEPEVTSPHQGCMFKVSKDGSKLEVIATGFRAPNGMTIGPRDEITVSDNQGHWMPSSKLNWIEPGGFYGMTPAAHRELKLWRDGTNFVADPSDPKARAEHKFKGWDPGSPQPEGYDEPIAWLPQGMDNSSGGQVWATTDKWGPLSGKLLFMSYGKCTLFEVMLDNVDGVRQAAMVQLPLKFNSGIMRGRVNPKDGQVYVAGLKGWQTSATRDGGFYRVRHTGKPLRMATSFHPTTEGVRIGFSTSLDKETASDPGSYNVERWDYKWTGAYGSPEFSVTDPNQKKHDKLQVEAATLSPDGRSVFLKIPGMKTCDQLKVSMSIDAAEGGEISEDIYATVHKLGATRLGSK